MDIYNTGEASAVNELNTKTFFQKLCPILLQAHKERVQKLGGRFGFCIAGEEAGSWLVDLNSATIKDGAGEMADVNISAWTEDFDIFLSGKVDALQLVQEKRLFIKGNPEKLKNLALFLSLAT